ncbi:hypothetical protein N7486_008457 [Penicillium sp. IBT 16267x]|nr:hypothetical protein N7486_008457 [Penicillium sp. IBT 16267x]
MLDKAVEKNSELDEMGKIRKIKAWTEEEVSGDREGETSYEVRGHHAGVAVTCFLGTASGST